MKKYQTILNKTTLAKNIRDDETSLVPQESTRALLALTSKYYFRLLCR